MFVARECNSTLPRKLLTKKEIPSFDPKETRNSKLGAREFFLPEQSTPVRADAEGMVHPACFNTDGPRRWN